MRYSPEIERRVQPDLFDNVTEEEIIALWHTFRASGLSGDDAWHAIVTGIALDMAFGRSVNLKLGDQ